MARIYGLWLLSLAIVTISMGTSCADVEEECEESDGVALLQFLNEAHATDAVNSHSDDMDDETGSSSQSQSHASAEWQTMKADINLDLPPRERFKELIRQQKDREMVGVTKLWATIESMFSPSVIDEWWQTLHGQFPVYEEEMAGAVDVFNENVTSDITVKKLLLVNILYDLGNPSNAACSGLLVQQPDGSIVHGRNLDYFVPFNWTRIDYEVTFHRNGTPLFISVSPGAAAFAVNTGARLGGWSFEQNTREPLNATLNLENAKAGSKPFGLAVREIMETTQDYSEAVRKLESIRFISRQYFILSGTKPNEGAVYAIDANNPYPPPYTTTFTLQSTIGRWFLVQTNDNLWGPDPGPDHLYRKTWAIAKMNQLRQDNVTVDFNKVKEIMSTPPLNNPLTLFTWVVNVQKGIHQLIPRPGI